MFALMPSRKRAALLPQTEETPFGWVPEVFNRFFRSWPVIETPEWLYPWGLTMEEKEKEVIVRAELPGFEPEEVKVELTGETLTVEAEHKEPAEKTEEKGKEKEKVEREYAHVKRTITLPPTVELEKAEAIYRNGVLEVHVPRKPEVVPRRIELKKT